MAMNTPMEIRKLQAMRGWTWIKQGWQLILRNPLMSFSMALIGALALPLAMLIPLLGPLLAVLLLPILLAGYMRACRALEEEEEAELAHLFAGFGQRTAGLVSLGAFLMLGLMLISALMAYLGGDAFIKLLETMQSTEDPQVLMDALMGMDKDLSTALLTGFALMLLLIAGWQYAPILVFFSGITPLVALRASFTGTLRNVIPYTLYSFIMQLLALGLGIIPFGLGMIVLLPLGLTSLYVSYRNIFPWLDAQDTSSAAPEATPPDTRDAP